MVRRNGGYASFQKKHEACRNRDILSTLPSTSIPGGKILDSVVEVRSRKVTFFATGYSVPALSDPVSVSGHPRNPHNCLNCFTPYSVLRMYIGCRCVLIHHPRLSEYYIISPLLVFPFAIGPQPIVDRSVRTPYFSFSASFPRHIVCQILHVSIGLAIAAQRCVPPKNTPQELDEVMEFGRRLFAQFAVGQECSIMRVPYP